MVKPLFIFPGSGAGYGINEYTEQPPLGIAYLASAAEKAGYDCEIIDANFLNYTAKETFEAITRKNPDIVCLSLFAFNFQNGMEIAEYLKSVMPHVIIVAGGAQVSAIMEKTLEKYDFIDAAVFGEGEQTFVEMLERIKHGSKTFEGIDGVIYKEGKNIIKNNSRRLIENLDNITFPALHLYPALSNYHRRALRTPAAPLLTSRGCPYECIFCSKSTFGRGVRFRSAENVINEIDYLVDRFGVKQIDIVDDNFIADRKRSVKVLDDLCRRSYRIAVNLQSGVSANLIDSDMLKLMKEAGVYRIAFGVESGSSNVLKQIKKRQNPGDIMRAAGLAKKAGITTDGFFMIGLPGDSPESMQETIDFAKKLDFDTTNFHMVVPFAGTELYDIIKKHGKFLKSTEYGIKSGYNYPDAFYELDALKKETIERYYKKAYLEFYFRPKKIIQIVLSIKSFKEFLWIFKTGMLVIKSIFKKRPAK